MNKKKVLGIVIVLIVVLVAIFVGAKFRKAIILRNITEKQDKIQEMKDDFYQKTSMNTDKAVIISEHYEKEGNSIAYNNIKVKETGETANSIMLSQKGTKTKTYCEIGKIDILNENGFSYGIIPDFRFEGNLWSIIKRTQEEKISVKTGTLNNKECYIINIGKMENAPEIYIEKETGLVVKMGNSEYEYEFGNVKDSIFVEPDSSKYQILEND